MKTRDPCFQSEIVGLEMTENLHYFPADTFPTIHPVHWLHSHFAVGGYSPMRRLSGMLTAHMTQIAPQNGFTWHPHRGLEIYTYVIEGELYHEDITGGRGSIHAGEVQRMFSGDYIAHQELNLTDEKARVIQIWLVADPKYRGLEPHYEQVRLQKMPAQQNGDAIVREIIGPGGATDAHVDARLTSAVLPAGGSTQLAPPQVGEDLFLYFVDGDGQVHLDDKAQSIGLYDVLVAGPDAPQVMIEAGESGLNFLSFYLDPFREN